jgi:carbonic anhydrase
VASRLASGQLFIHGWVYDIETSEIKAYDAEQGEFRLIGDGPLPMATPRPRYLQV